LQRDNDRIGARFVAARERVGDGQRQIHNLPRARAYRAAAAGFDLRRLLVEVRAVGKRNFDDAVFVVDLRRRVPDFEGRDGKAPVDGRRVISVVTSAALAARYDAVGSGPKSLALDRVLRALGKVLRRGRGRKHLRRSLAEGNFRRGDAREVCRVGDAGEADRAGRAGRLDLRAVFHAVDLDDELRDRGERLAYDLDAVLCGRCAVLGGDDDVRPVVQVDVTLAGHVDACCRLVGNIRLEAQLCRVDAGDNGDKNIGRSVVVLRDLHVLHILVRQILVLNLNRVGEERRALALDIRVILRRDVIGLP